MSIWIQQCKSQISSSYHIHITFISHSYHIHITFVSHSYHSVTQTIHHILALDSVTVTSHHPRWPNVLFQQGTSEWQPVKKCKEDRERMGKVWKGTQMLRICWLLYSRSQMYIIYIYGIYTLWLLATSTFVKLLKGHCSRQILVSIWISKNPFLLHVVWTQKCIQVRIGPFSLCKSCT